MISIYENTPPLPITNTPVKKTPEGTNNQVLNKTPSTQVQNNAPLSAEVKPPVNNVNNSITTNPTNNNLSTNLKSNNSTNAPGAENTAGDRYSKLAKYAAIIGGSLAAGGLLHSLSNNDLSGSSGALTSSPPDDESPPMENKKPVPKTIEKPTEKNLPNPKVIHHHYYQYPPATQYELMSSQPEYAKNYLVPGNPSHIRVESPFNHVPYRRTFRIPAGSGLPLGSSGTQYSWRPIY